MNIMVISQPQKQSKSNRKLNTEIITMIDKINIQRVHEVKIL